MQRDYGAAFPNSDEKTENSKIRIMNKKKELKSTHSRLIQRLVWALILTLGIVSFGCQCDCEEDADEYYVKYEVDSYTMYSHLALHTTVNNEKNNDVNFTFDAGTHWETIIGPVQKGFKATIGVSLETEVLIHLKIYVSKNDSPFAIKANDNSEAYRKAAQLSYTIDY